MDIAGRRDVFTLVMGLSETEQCVSGRGLVVLEHASEDVAVDECLWCSTSANRVPDGRAPAPDARY